VQTRDSHVATGVPSRRDIYGVRLARILAVVVRKPEQLLDAVRERVRSTLEVEVQVAG
jgi:hypothetical protein